MRKLWLLPCLALTLAAQTPQALTAPIRRVRLHPDEAWVTRVGQAKVPAAGVHRLLLKDLPQGLGMDDVRVAARGPQGSRLGDLSLGSDPRTVAETPEYQALVKELEGLQDRQDALEAEGEALAQERAFLKGIQGAYDKEISGRLTVALPAAASVVELSRGLEGRSNDVLLRDRRRNRELAKLREQLSRLEAELRRRAAERSASPGRALVEIATDRAGEVEVEFTYRNRQARWVPGYEARLAPDGRKVEVALFATVRQGSGEDWNGVQLEITNARSSRTLTLARFSGPGYVGHTEREPQAYDSQRRAKGMALMEVLAPPPPAMPQNTYVEDAEPASAAAVEEAQGLASTWLLDGSKDVPADNEPHRFRILARDLEATLALVAVPRLDPTVYRLARFPLPSGLPLFPGAPVVHFAGTQRVGQASLELPGPGQPLQFGFGPYRGVRVALHRVEAVKEQVGAFTKEAQWTLRERMEVANDTKDALEVELQDRELKASSDKVKITVLGETTPSKDGPVPGVRSWTLKLAPQGSASVALATQIRTPAGGTVTGLRDLHLPE